MDFVQRNSIGGLRWTTRMFTTTPDPSWWRMRSSRRCASSWKTDWSCWSWCGRGPAEGWVPQPGCLRAMCRASKVQSSGADRPVTCRCPSDRMCGGRVPTALVYDFQARTFRRRDFYAPGLLGAGGKKIFFVFCKNFFKKKLFFFQKIFFSFFKN